MTVERFYAIRRADGELMGDEYAFLTVAGPDDWSPAHDDAEDRDEPVDYELITFAIEAIAKRTLPECRECDKPARHWGLCRHHAELDDPEAFADEKIEVAP
jgi:hypothetical protein